MSNSTTRGAIASNVRAELARRGHTQETAGAAIGMTPFALGRRLRGEVEFSATELQSLAQLFGIPVASLYSEVSA